jgi:hypothetical protein
MAEKIRRPGVDQFGRPTTYEFEPDWTVEDEEATLLPLPAPEYRVLYWRHMWGHYGHYGTLEAVADFWDGDDQYVYRIEAADGSAFEGFDAIYDLLRPHLDYA